MYMKARGIIDGREFSVRYQMGKLRYPKEYAALVNERFKDYQPPYWEYSSHPDVPFNAYLFLMEGLFDEVLYFKRDGKEPLFPYREGGVY